MSLKQTDHFSGDNPFSGENPLKRVLPQTPFLNFELGLGSPDKNRNNQPLSQSLGEVIGGRPFSKDHPQKGFPQNTGYPALLGWFIGLALVAGTLTYIVIGTPAYSIYSLLLAVRERNVAAAHS